jgi:2-oxoglutarate/2-oxoacid ferredoxin oxidoreductase subunit alpha
MRNCPTCRCHRLRQTHEELRPLPPRSQTLARPWAVPGTEGLEHRIGGLEKQDVTGMVTYDSENHRRMVELRDQKVCRDSG